MLMEELIAETFGSDITTINKVKVELERRILAGTVTDIDLLEKPNSILRDIISSILPIEENGTVGTLVLNNDVYEGDGDRYVLVSNSTGTGTGTGTGEFVQGPVGPQGETGLQGYNGSRGDTGYVGSMGYVGSQGERGLTGYNGSVGNQGPAGPIGLTGPVGPIGYIGSRGVTGYGGSVGPTGIQGEVGSTGYNGSRGNTGFTGSIGYTGSKGDQGDQGIPGPQGIQGLTGFVGSKGETGPAGTVGNAATATLAAKASTLAMGGGNGAATTFTWTGQQGQPTWLWGGNDAVNMTVWNPSNFNVNSALTATTATRANFLSFAGLATATTCATLMSLTTAANASVREVNAFADAPNTGYWFIHSIRHSNTSNLWGTQIAFGWENNANTIYQRNVSNGTWSGWTVVNHDNTVNDLVAGMGAVRTVAGSNGSGKLTRYTGIGYEVFKPYSKACQVRPIQQLQYYNCNCDCNCSD